MYVPLWGDCPGGGIEGAGLGIDGWGEGWKRLNYEKSD